MSRRHRASGALPTAPGDTEGRSETPLTSDCSRIWQEKPPSSAPAPSGLHPGTTRSQRQPEGLGPGTAEPCNQPLPSPHSSFLAVTHKLDPNPCSCSTLPLRVPPQLPLGRLFAGAGGMLQLLLCPHHSHRAAQSTSPRLRCQEVFWDADKPHNF